MKTRFGRQGTLGQAFVWATIVLALSLPPSVAHATTADDDFVESAQEYYAKGDLPAALIELKNALQENPNNRAARSLLGRMYLDRRDFPNAEKELSRAWDAGLRPRRNDGDRRGRSAAAVVAVAVAEGEELGSNLLHLCRRRRTKRGIQRAPGVAASTGPKTAQVGLTGRLTLKANP